LKKKRIERGRRKRVKKAEARNTKTTASKEKEKKKRVGDSRKEEMPKPKKLAKKKSVQGMGRTDRNVLLKARREPKSNTGPCSTEEDYEPPPKPPFKVWDCEKTVSRRKRQLEERPEKEI